MHREGIAWHPGILTWARRFPRRCCHLKSLRDLLWRVWRTDFQIPWWSWDGLVPHDILRGWGVAWSATPKNGKMPQDLFLAFDVSGDGELTQRELLGKLLGFQKDITVTLSHGMKYEFENSHRSPFNWIGDRKWQKRWLKCSVCDQPFVFSMNKGIGWDPQKWTRVVHGVFGPRFLEGFLSVFTAGVTWAIEWATMQFHLLLQHLTAAWFFTLKTLACWAFHP